MPDFGILFEYLGEIVELRYTTKNLLVRSSQYGTQFDYIYNSFDETNVYKQFPELEGDKDWRIKAYDNLLQKIDTFPTDDTRIKYIISELKQYGYLPLYILKNGFRPMKVKDAS